MRPVGTLVDWCRRWDIGRLIVMLLIAGAAYGIARALSWVVP